MIYQPRNVQPSGVSIDGLLDNTFTMEIQTNSYVSAYQLLIVDFNNNEIYTGSKTTLTNYAYNGDTLEIPVNASTVALSNGTNYKWRVRLYQPTADMLITYGLVQSTSTTTTIYLQPNINIKAGMAITINSQTKTISSYNSDTGVAVVSSAFSSAPVVGTQYKIYSDFIETVPDYIVYARRTPAVAISNVPSSLTLKYHTFQGTYIQSDNVAIVYHQFDLYTRNDDGTISLVASSDKVYSANLSYTYDSFRTGNKYLIQMTVENDMGVITTTDMYEFNVSYDIVEYLQQPLASFDDKNNAVKVSWVTPVENEATSLRSDAATGIIQDNNNTLTQATFEPGQSIGEGDVVQITNSDCELVVDGRSTQETRSGKNLYNATVKQQGGSTNRLNASNFSVLPNTTYTLSTTSSNFEVNNYYKDADGNNIAELRWVSLPCTFTTPENCYYIAQTIRRSDNSDITPSDFINVQLEIGSTPTEYEPYGASPSPDYPSEIESVGYSNLIPTNETEWEQGTINGGSNEANTTRLRTKNYIEINENTLYTFRLENALIGNVWFYDAQKQVVNNLYDMIFQTGMQSVEFTTPKNTKYYKVVIRYEDNSVITSQEISEIKPMIEKGSTIHSYIPLGKYGIEVKTVGKNLFDNSNVVNGFPNLTINDTLNYTNSGVTVSYEKCCYVEIGKKYTISYKKNTPASTSSRAGVIVDKNNIILQTIGAWSNSTDRTTFTANYSGWLIFPSDKNTTDIQIEEGEVATEYTPYQEQTTLIELNEPLRSLPNGVKDIAYIKNNKLYVDRYVGSKVLNGSEIWLISPTYTNDTYFCSWMDEAIPNANYDVFTMNDTFSKGLYTEVLDKECMADRNQLNVRILANRLTENSVDGFKTWLSQNNVQIDYELATPITEEIGDSTIPYIDGINYMYISSNMDTTFSLVYPYKTISGNTYDYIEFNPPGVKQTGTIKSYNAITGVGTLMSQYPFTYSPIQGDPYAVISNIYNISGFSYLYNTPYNTVNSLYTHGYTATWATPDGLCVLPDDFNITLQFSPDGNFYYTDDGTYQEVVNLITTETDDINNRGEFTIKIDKNKLIFTQQTEDGGSIVWDGNTEGKISVQGMLYKLSDITPSKEDLIGNKLTLTSPDEVKTFNIVAEDDGVSSDICCPVDLDDSGNYAIATLLPVVVVITTPTSTYPSTGIYFLYYDGMYVSELGLGNIVLEAPFYTHTNQVFVLSSASITQINNDYVWDDTATWTDTYTWVEGGTSLERVCNHWWKVQITNTGIKIEEIFPTT